MSNVEIPALDHVVPTQRVLLLNMPRCAIVRQDTLAIHSQDVHKFSKVSNLCSSGCFKLKALHYRSKQVCSTNTLFLRYRARTSSEETLLYEYRNKILSPYVPVLVEELTPNFYLPLLLLSISSFPFSGELYVCHTF
jgi:hypothetical protein